LGEKSRHEGWLARKRRIRRKAKGTEERPRLSVFRSSKHIYAQVIDDLSGQTLAAASSLEEEVLGKLKGAEGAKTGNREGAALVGRLLGDRAKTKGVGRVVFDRNGFLYHGRVKALADGVREAGVQF